MPSQSSHTKLITVKPRSVLLAEWALWAWTTWVCLHGFYDSWTEMPEIARQISGQSAGAITLDAQSGQKWAVLYYIFQAVTTVWFILKIGEGKHWARSSFMWCFALQILWMGVSNIMEPSLSLADIPDVALQAVAMYLLYTKPGADWFVVKKTQTKTV